ncbi:PDR/VanB family oxidoreductase [Pseudomonas sp. NGC7]|uniref:PDR/VanB family oxidoreductase n=1 Tax=Pseudomonas sp. NGC7 TaxID=3341775 RepID=UPI0037DBCBCB
MQSPILNVKVAGVRRLTDRINEYLLTSLDGSPLPRYEPGAHIELHLKSPVNGDFVRHYSLIGGTGMNNDPACQYRIAVQREPHLRGSAFIHDNLVSGSELRISWPKNNFVLGRNDPHVLLIAGGIGITPIYAMLRSLARRNRSYSFLYSGRTETALAYRDDVMSIAGNNGTLHFSGEPATDHLDFVALLREQPEDTVIYICGPKPMLDAAYRAGEQLGWAPERIRSEQFGVASSADDCAFDVVLNRSGKTVTVGRDTSILDALTAAGVDLLSDCRRGECGLCPLSVISSESTISHRDRYLSQAEKDEGKTLCLCVSRISGGTLVLDA